MYPYRHSHNEIQKMYQSPRASIFLNPSLTKSLNRATSLNNINLPTLSRKPQILLSTPSETPHLSPLLHKSYKSPSARLSTLPSLSTSVKSSRPHGIVKAYCANTHKGLVRNLNEDRVMIISKISKPESRKTEKWPISSFYGIYDGHMGKECCNFLRDNLHTFIINDPAFPTDPVNALLNGFSKAEDKFKQIAIEHNLKSGSCAIVILIVGKICYLANLGDSRAVLSESKFQKITQISKDHVPHDETERQRISLAGAEVVYSKHPGNSKQFVSRLMPGGISVSRCFGDIDAKLKELGGNPNALIAIPEISVFKLHSDTDFILMGSDGTFEKIENKNAVNMIWETSLSSLEMEASGKIGKSVEKIMVEAMIRNATDNITIVVIAFKNFCKELGEDAN